MNSIKAILHDWDDTITNSFESYTQFYFDLGKFHDLGSPKIEDIRKHWGGTIPEIVNGIWPYLSKQEAKDKTEKFIENLKLWRKSYTAKVFPNIKNTFKKLNSLGIKLGVISSGNSAQMKRIYTDQIDKNISYHCFLYDNKELGYTKPDPRIFNKAIEELNKFGINESEIIYVGDSFQDYDTAKNRTLPFYAVTTGLKTKEEFLQVGLKKENILPDFNKVLDLFE